MTHGASPSAPQSSFFQRILALISSFFKSLWLFFPALLFVALSMAIFWMIGQGKDLIVAFTENRKARWFFFLALVFWVYLTWYSSRIVAYMKKRQQENYLAEFSAGASLKADPKKFALPPLFLDNAPRILGFGCFLVLELAIFQVPLFNKKPLSGLMAFLIFIIGIILFGLFDRRVARLSDRNQMLVRWLFRGCVLAFLVICGILTIDKNQSIWWLLVLLILLHFAFLFAINLRRKVLEDPTSKSNVAARSVIVSNNIFYRVMNTFWIPAKEINYYTAFVIFIFAGLLLYGLSIFNFRFSVLIGPLPFVLLAFTALLAVGNLVTSFSIKYSVNFHLILILLAVFLGAHPRQGRDDAQPLWLDVKQ